MKTIITTVLILFLCSLTPTYSFCEELGSIRLSLIEGNVRIYDRESEEWTPASINMPLAIGDQISVPRDGRAELHIQGGIFVRLDYLTSLELVSLSETDAHFYLDQGQIYINNKKGGREIIQIDTPSATCTTADNSISLLEVSDSETTELSIVKGYAFLESRQGKTRVTSGNTLKVNRYGAEISPIAVPDEWEKWNHQRDASLQIPGESARYLPEELHEYSNDFDKNGKWTFVKELGYIWTPTVISFEWVPFRLGQWIWVQNDYVWVPQERWGWAPHHYGRWANIKGTGWCWVPPRAGSVAWGPGFVAWVQTPSSIGWVPLAPGEMYYGRKNYGHGTAVLQNRKNDYPVPVYRNVNINNAVTVVSVNSFHKRDKQKTLIKGENPFKNKDNSVHLIAAPPTRKARTDKPFQPKAAPVVEKPTMHPQQQGRGTTSQSYATPQNQTRTPEALRVDPKNIPAGKLNRPAATAPSVTNKEPLQIAPVPLAPLRQQQKPAAAQPVINPAIQSKPNQDIDKKRELRENRGPRGFVRDSGQSAFKKEQPQQLPLKKLDEPKKEPRKQPERSKRDDINSNNKPDDRGTSKNTPKAKADKP